jgi:hypothetical protein
VVLRLLASAAALFVLAGEPTAQPGRADNVWVRRPPGAGAYQEVRELSGRVELSQFSARPDPGNLEAVCRARQEAEAALTTTFEPQIREGEPASAGVAADQLVVRHAAAQARAYLGDMIGTARHLRAALDIVDHTGAPEAERLYAKTHFHSLLGTAELRRGELENCLHDRNASRCIFPLTPPGEHAQTSGAEAALASFLDALRLRPEDLEARWLANLAAMTLGKHPGALPARFRIEAAAFAGTPGALRFVDEAPSLGLDMPDRAGGTIVDDIDGDGRLDVVLSSVDPCVPLKVLAQGPDGRFTDVSSEAGVLDQVGGINLVQTDYDNDGHPDVFVMRGGWELPARNSLLRNTGAGTFVDVTAAAGLLDVPHATHSAAWADYDLDGWLDVFVGHEDTRSTLFRNRRNGTFEDVTAAAGLDVTTFTKGVAWGDYDRDGDPDLYVSNYAGPNRLFRNNGDGTFTDVTAQMGVARPIMSFTTWFFDYDNDGWVDLFVAGFVPSVAESVKPYVGEPPSSDTMRLYRNVKGERFEDVTAAAGLERTTMVMGANFGDFDSDGWLDFYLGTGAPSYAALVPNLMFRNEEGRSFSDVTAATGTGHLQKGHGLAFADIDGDGDQDLLVNVGGFVPGDTYPRVLFRNPDNRPAWIEIRLKGTRTNRLGLGARVTVTAVAPDGSKRTIPRVVSTGGSYGASPTVLHVGLGNAVSVEQVEVYWPVSRRTQVERDVPLRKRLVIEEPM